MTDLRDNFASRDNHGDADKAVEWELVEHYRRELEPHRGQARAKFEAALTQSATPRQSGSRQAWWIGSGFGLAAAAAVAAGFWMSGDMLGPLADPTLPIAVHTDGPTQPNNSSGMLNADWSPTNVARQELWRTQNAGRVLIDGQPAQALLNERWQTTQFTDSDGYNVSITLPDHEMVFVNVGDE